MLSSKWSRSFSDNVEFLEEVEDDLAKIDGSLIKQIANVINKVARNPKPKRDGGFGKPLRNDESSQLSGYNKIKLVKAGIRIVYKLREEKGNMLVIIIAARADNYVYQQAVKRIKKYNL